MKDMKPLLKYEIHLVCKYRLPSVRCVYNPDVYWKLSKTEKETLHHLRRNNHG